MFIFFLAVAISGMFMILISKSVLIRLIGLLILVAFYFALPFGGGFYDDSYVIASDVVNFTTRIERDLKSGKLVPVVKMLEEFNQCFLIVALDTEKRQSFIASLLGANDMSMQDSISKPAGVDSLGEHNPNLDRQYENGYDRWRHHADSMR